ncbi:MAG: cytochrome P450 [Ilumatobacteraceae bacterium]
MTDTAPETEAGTQIIKSSPDGAHGWLRKPFDPADYGPVTDWENDFDHCDPQYSENAHQIWRDLVEGGCPVAHTERYGGTWLPLTHETVHEIAYDPQHFSSRNVIVSSIRPGDLSLPAPIGGAPPITSDPPFHADARRILLPPFAPKKIAEWEPKIRDLCRRLLNNMGDIEPGTTIVDSAKQYAQHIPVAVIREMLGFPEEDEELFRDFIHRVIEQVNADPAERAKTQHELLQYVGKQVQDHIDNPRDDLTNYMMNVEFGGNKLSPEHVSGTILLLLIAGIDTTWSTIGSSLWHLSQNPQHCKQLVDDPDLMTFAVEEFLRAYAPVTMARMVVDDYEFHGCPMKKDDWVLLPFPAANRDPEQFDRADEFVIDRQENRHAAFGLGIHRCLGSNLARLEVRVAIEEFLARFPRFELSGDVSWSTGQIRGPREIPVRILP